MYFLKSKDDLKIKYEEIKNDTKFFISTIVFPWSIKYAEKEDTAI